MLFEVIRRTILEVEGCVLISSLNVSFDWTEKHYPFNFEFRLYVFITFFLSPCKLNHCRI